MVFWFECKKEPRQKESRRRIRRRWVVESPDVVVFDGFARKSMRTGVEQERSLASNSLNGGQAVHAGAGVRCCVAPEHLQRAFANRVVIGKHHWGQVTLAVFWPQFVRPHGDGA